MSPGEITGPDKNVGTMPTRGAPAPREDPDRSKRPARAEGLVTWAAVTIDSCSPRRVAVFWGALLGDAPREVGRPGWYRIGPLVDGGPALTIQPVPEPKVAKTRMHLDVRVGELDAAIITVSRLGGSGPSELHRYDEGTVAVMADPEGNEFCLVALVPGAALA
jgi:hypothetical protein